MPQLEEKLQFPRWRHLPQDGDLLRVQRTQPAARVFGQVKDGRWELIIGPLFRFASLLQRPAYFAQFFAAGLSYLLNHWFSIILFLFLEMLQQPQLRHPAR